MKKSFLIPAVFLTITAIALIVVLAKKASAPETRQETAAANTALASDKDSPPQPDEEPGQYIDYSEERVAQIKGEKVLFFHAPWCPQCRSIEKSILENKGSIPSGVTIMKVDYDSHQGLRQKYGVTIQTTFVKIDDSGNLIDKYVAYDEPNIGSVKRNFL